MSEKMNAIVFQEEHDDEDGLQWTKTVMCVDGNVHVTHETSIDANEFRDPRQSERWQVNRCDGSCKRREMPLPEEVATLVRRFLEAKEMESGVIESKTQLFLPQRPRSSDRW